MRCFHCHQEAIAVLVEGDGVVQGAVCGLCRGPVGGTLLADYMEPNRGPIVAPDKVSALRRQATEGRSRFDRLLDKVGVPDYQGIGLPPERRPSCAITTWSPGWCVESAVYTALEDAGEKDALREFVRRTQEMDYREKLLVAHQYVNFR